MVKINLLPFRAARKQENVRHQVTIFLLLLGLTTVVMFWIHSAIGNKVFALQTRVGETREELKRVEIIAKEVTELKAHLEKVRKRLDIIDGLKKNRAAPVHLMDDLTQWVIPKRMWLTQVINEEAS